jgi:hypothetical protein
MAIALCFGSSAVLAAEADSNNTVVPAAAYHIYAGSTHAHTSNTWSHEDHFINAKKEPGEAKCREQC